MLDGTSVRTALEVEEVEDEGFVVVGCEVVCADAEAVDVTTVVVKPCDDTVTTVVTGTFGGGSLVPGAGVLGGPGGAVTVGGVVSGFPAHVS